MAQDRETQKMTHHTPSVCSGLAAHKLVAASHRYLAIFARTVAIPATAVHTVTHAGIMQQLSYRSGGLRIQLLMDKLAALKLLELKPSCALRLP